MTTTFEPNYDVTVCSIQDGVPAFLHVEFEKYDEAVAFARQYNRYGSTPSIYNKKNDYWLMIGGFVT